MGHGTPGELDFEFDKDQKTKNRPSEASLKDQCSEGEFVTRSYVERKMVVEPLVVRKLK